MGPLGRRKYCSSSLRSINYLRARQGQKSLLRACQDLLLGPCSLSGSIMPRRRAKHRFEVRYFSDCSAFGSPLALASGILREHGGHCFDGASLVELRPVRAITVGPKPIDDDREAVSEIKPRYESDLGFRVAGKVLSRTVDVDDAVSPVM